MRSIASLFRTAALRWADRGARASGPGGCVALEGRGQRWGLPPSSASPALRPRGTGWTTAALGAIAVPAVLGVIALLPRTSLELPWQDTRSELFALDPDEATLRLADRRLELAEQRERRSARRRDC